MATPERRPVYREYTPKPNDPVMVEGVIGRLMVVNVDEYKQTVIVAAATTPRVYYTVPWSKLSFLNER